MRPYFSFLLLIFFLSNVHAQSTCKISGRIANEEGQAIPYCSIYIPQLSTGSMANINGEFALKLPCGSYTLKVQSLGYEAKSMEVEVRSEEDLSIVLRSISYQLQEVTIDPNSEDPAYNIIRKATVMAEYYKKQITAYKATLYVRNYFNVDDLPWIAEKLADEDDLRIMKAGDITETVVEYSYERPNKVKERIIARKSGSTDTLRGGSEYINLNFYNLGGQEIINPLSKGAFQVYEFEYQHTEFHDSRKVHKIKIIPRRKGNDLMKGYLYINDGIWNLNNVDVSFEQPMVSIDYKQTFQEVDSLAWMPINHQLKVGFKAVGFKVKVNYLATLRDLSIETDPEVDRKIRKRIRVREKDKVADSSIAPQIKYDRNLSKTEKKIEEIIQKDELSNREAIKLVRLIKKQEREIQKEQDSLSYDLSSQRSVEYADSAFSKNDSLWDAAREIPLSDVEQKIYSEHDSIRKIKNGDTIVNKKRSTVGKFLFFNGTLPTKNKKVQFSPNGLLSGLGGSYNTVDGLLLKKELFDYRKNSTNGNYWQFTPTIEYAFARETFMGYLDFESQYNFERQAQFYFSAGRRSSDFNRTSPLDPIINSISTLLSNENYKKLYQEDFIHLEHQFDLANGFRLSNSIDYSERTQLLNNTDYQLFENDEKPFSDNIPDHPELAQSDALISSHDAFSIRAELSYTPEYYYRKMGNKKIMVSSRYPTFGLEYRQGIPDVFESDVQYQQLSFSMKQQMNTQLIDHINYHLEAGTFLNSSSLFFADFQDFGSGPYFLLNSSASNGFKLLDPYVFNSSEQYFEGHLSLEDNFLLLKNLPILNGTNFTEKIHLNYLRTELDVNYYEVGYSLERIFLLFNVGVYANFIDEEHQLTGVRIGMSIR